MQHLPVIFCMDRAGLVGEDGQTHMGLYDIAYMLAVPGMTVTAPKDGDELIGLLRTALRTRRPVLHPLSARQGAGRAAAGRRDPGRCRTAPGSSSGAGKDVAILAVGTMVQPALEAAELLARRRHRLRGGELPLPQAAGRRDAGAARCSSTASW